MDLETRRKLLRRNPTIVCGSSIAATLAFVLVSSQAHAMDTIVGGDAYVAQCLAEGVPTPPIWNYEDAWHGVNGTQWVRSGVLTTDFIGGSTVGEVFYYESTVPGSEGLCIALPRSNFPAGQSPEDGPPTSIDLLGVICQGSVSSKACFYDAEVGINLQATQTLRFGTGPVEEFFNGGADLENAGGGICTNCHRGENVFIVHPASTLGGLPGLMANDWVDPIVVESWPQNEGPTSLTLPADACTNCHSGAGDRSSPLFGGRFPEVSNQTAPYCNTILNATVNGPTPTMPVTGSPPFLAFEALMAACAQDPPSGVPFSKEVMSMEPPEDGSSGWQSEDAPLEYVLTPVAEGETALAVNGDGYTRLDSAPFPSWDLEFLGTQLSVEVYVPEDGQPEPHWLGAVQLYVTVPSALLYNEFVGQLELTPSGTGWQTGTFDISPEVQAILAQPHNDVSFGIAVNTPQGAPPVILDNLRFEGILSMPPEAPDLGPVKYDFERGDVWLGFDGGVASTSISTAVGGFNSSRALAADLFYATEGRVWTTPTESPEAGETLTFRVYVGADAPVVAVSPYVMDAFWSWTDTWNTAIAEDGWTTVSVVVPQWATTPLSQIGVKIYFSEPYSGSFYVDAVEW